MVLSLVKALKKRNINYQQELLVEATDISDVCAYMTYIQLSLYGIPAIVYCGNTLTREIRFVMRTPLYCLQYLKFNSFFMNNENENIEKASQIGEKVVAKSLTENQNLFKEIIINGNSQVSLW